jgi:hypothetical protein
LFAALYEKDTFVPLPLGYIAITGFVGLVGYLAVRGKARKVFISYYSKRDSHYKNLIVAWAKNNKFKLNIEDVSTDIKIKSENLQYLKRRMKEKIGESDCVIVFVGVDTHERPWVDWEVEKAIELKKPIIAVKEKRTHKSPKSLLGCGAIWINGFSEEKIREALKVAFL